MTLIPESAVSGAIDGITAFFASYMSMSGFGPIIFLLIGVPLAFVVIHRIMNLQPKK